MFLPTYLSTAKWLLLTLSTLSHASLTSKSLQARAEDWDFSTCFQVSPGFYSIYIITSDSDIGMEYRNAVLFDSECNVIQAVAVSKTVPKITLRGSLNYYVDIFVDENSTPNGHVDYCG